MASPGNHQIYHALPISDDALDRGGIELLRAAVVDEELFVMARLEAFPDPGPWGFVLADIARRLASLYAAGRNLAEAKATDAIAAGFARAFRRRPASAAGDPSPGARDGSKPAKPAKSVRPRAKGQAHSPATPKPATAAAARRKGAPAKS